MPDQPSQQPQPEQPQQPAAAPPPPPTQADLDALHGTYYTIFSDELHQRSNDDR